MRGIDRVSPLAVDDSRASLLDLRRAMFEVVVVALVFLAAALALLTTDDLAPRTWLPAATIFLGSVLARALVGRNWSLAASVLGAGLLLSILAATTVYPALYTGAAVAIAVMLSGVVLSRQYAIGMSVVLTALILAPGDWPWPPSVGPRNLDLAIIAWSSAAVAWLICQPILISLDCLD